MKEKRENTENVIYIYIDIYLYIIYMHNIELLKISYG